MEGEYLLFVVCLHTLSLFAKWVGLSIQQFHMPFIQRSLYVVCPKSKYTDFLFKCLLDSPEITSYLLQSVTLGKLHSGSSVFFADHSSTGSHFA